MRKRIALLIALVLVLTAAFPVIAACNKEKAVINLKFVDPKTSYNVGDTIEYDNLKVEITYEDQSKETKSVKELKALGAELKEADLSKSGNSFYSLSYKKITARVDISVSATNVDVKDEVTVVLNYHDNKTNPVTITLERNTSLGDKLPTPTREGYTFDGWFTEETGGTKWEASAPVQGNILNLHAHWTEIKVEKVTVTFYDVAEHVYRSFEINKGDKISAFPANPVREGYTFDGWYTEAEGGDKWNLDTVVNEALSLYAHWTEGSGEEKTQVTVTLHYQDGKTSDGFVVIDKGTALGDKLPANPTRPDYTFEGWYTDATEGEKWSAEALVEEDLDLYAHWEKVVVEHVTVTLVFHDDKTDNRVLNDVIKGSSLGDLLPSDITRTNYEFLGWFTLEVDGTEWTSSMPVNTDITLHAHWKQTIVPPTVTRFAVPTEYQAYVDASAPLAGVEGADDFRIRGEVYEVGTVNRFVFNPIFYVMENGQPTEKDNPTTIAKVYTKASAEGNYTELVGDEKNAFVTKIGNTYRFGETAKGGTYVKLEISLDTQSYDVPAEINNLLTVEFVLVEGGYNVYDQLGLSVMADLQKMAWSEIWKCTTKVEGNRVICVSNANSLQLPWDDDFLCNYVDKVSTVIMHRTIKLDADQMPSLYFWTKEPGLVTSDLFTKAWDSIKGLSAFSNVTDENNPLVGTLRGGDNSAEINDRNYMRIIDAEPSSEGTEGDYKVYGQQSIETGIWLNMQKALFATKKVSVSGNYQSLITPNKGERSTTYNRLLEVYVDWNDTAVQAPDTVYSVFHMLQSQREGADVEEFAIKNLAMKGNNPKSNEDGFVSAGLMILDSYNMKQSYYNVNASQFCRMMSADDYGVISADENGKVGTGTPLDARVSFEGVKFYDAYSNMFAMWRSTVDIKNSEMIGCGGPLFIMNDGERTISGNPTNTDNTGCELTVDDKSVLQAYATGNENWYATWNAQMLFQNIGNTIEPIMQGYFNKTLQAEKNGIKYYNVIAAMICTPGDLFNGNKATNANDVIDVRGTFTQNSANKSEFKMHNDLLVALRNYSLLMKQNMTACAPIVQAGDNFFALKDSSTAIVYSEENQSPVPGVEIHVKEVPITDLVATWRGITHDKVCVYLSVAPMSETVELASAFAPYFAIVLDLYPLQQA